MHRGRRKKVSEDFALDRPWNQPCRWRIISRQAESEPGLPGGDYAGESGLATIQETARRICYAAGHNLADIGGLVFSEDLPRFGSFDHEDALRRFIMDDELEVVEIDPAYMCIPGATPATSLCKATCCGA